MIESMIVRVWNIRDYPVWTQPSDQLLRSIEKKAGRARIGAWLHDRRSSHALVHPWRRSRLQNSMFLSPSPAANRPCLRRSRSIDLSSQSRQLVRLSSCKSGRLRCRAALTRSDHNTTTYSYTFVSSKITYNWNMIQLKDPLSRNRSIPLTLAIWPRKGRYLCP